MNLHAEVMFQLHVLLMCMLFIVSFLFFFSFLGCSVASGWWKCVCMQVSTYHAASTRYRALLPRKKGNKLFSRGWAGKLFSLPFPFSRLGSLYGYRVIFDDAPGVACVFLKLRYIHRPVE